MRREDIFEMQRLFKYAGCGNVLQDKRSFSINELQYFYAEHVRVV